MPTDVIESVPADRGWAMQLPPWVGAKSALLRMGTLALHRRASMPYTALGVALGGAWASTLMVTTVPGATGLVAVAVILTGGFGVSALRSHAAASSDAPSSSARQVTRVRRRAITMGASTGDG